MFRTCIIHYGFDRVSVLAKTFLIRDVNLNAFFS